MPCTHSGCICHIFCCLLNFRLWALWIMLGPEWKCRPPFQNFGNCTKGNCSQGSGGASLHPSCIYWYQRVLQAPQIKPFPPHLSSLLGSMTEMSPNISCRMRLLVAVGKVHTMSPSPSLMYRTSSTTVGSLQNKLHSLAHCLQDFLKGKITVHLFCGALPASAVHKNSGERKRDQLY